MPRKSRGAPSTRDSEDVTAVDRLSRAVSWVVEYDESIEVPRDINIFYVYTHSHPVTRSTFYVGKGLDSRAWNMFNRHPRHTAKLYEFLKEGHSPGSWVSIVKWGLTEYEALRLEEDVIRDLRRDNVELLNRGVPLRTLVSERTVGGWRVENPSPVSEMQMANLRAAALVDLRSCDIKTAEGLRRAIEIHLRLLPAHTFYLSMWELLSKLKIPRGPQRSDATKRVAAVFESGIPGWLLDGDLYIRRIASTASGDPS